MDNCVGGCWGSPGENTDGAVTPEDVNGGYNIEDPLIVDDPVPPGLEVGMTCVDVLMSILANLTPAGPALDTYNAIHLTVSAASLGLEAANYATERHLIRGS